MLIRSQSSRATLDRLREARRINVTGNAGSGKSTTARMLGEQLGLPVHSLDSIVWQSGWSKTPTNLRQSLESQLIDQPAWIVDGVSTAVREASDVVIFLDAPTGTCLKRATLRTLKHLWRQRPELPPACPEWRIYPRLVRMIFRFSRHAGLEIRREAEQDSKYLVLSNAGSFEALMTTACRLSTRTLSGHGP
jgi:adenylate kinase family enzyme